MAKTETQSANSSRTMVPARGMEGSGLTFINPAELNREGKLGLIAAGIYVGTVRNERYERDDFKIETEDGKTLVINKAGNLAYQFDGVEPGTYVEVSYEGMKTIQSGPRKGKDSHTFKVLKAE